MGWYLPETTLETSRKTRALRTAALLAATAWLAPGLAQAQSSLVIYGIVDQGISKSNNGTTPGALLPGRGTQNTWVLKHGNASRLGFRGQEDLGGGLYSRFQLEHRFIADTGLPSNANLFWLGRSVVALGSTSWGEIYAGREYSPAFWPALDADPTAWSYVSQLGAAYTYANYTAVPAAVEANNIRWANSVGYKSPQFAGLSFELAHAFGENLRGNNLSGNLRYKQGALWLGAAFDRLDSRNNLGLVSGGYDFGVVHPSFSYARAKGGINGDAKSFSLAAKVPVSFGRVYAQYGTLRPASNLDSNMLGAGLEFVLSKRTLVYTNLGSAKRDGNTRTTAFDLGVKHTF
jgi:predicted porin